MAELTRRSDYFVRVASFRGVAGISSAMAHGQKGMDMLGTMTAFVAILMVLALRNLAKAALMPVYAVRDIHRGRYVRGLVLLSCSGLAAWTIWSMSHPGRTKAAPVAAVMYTG